MIDVASLLQGGDARTDVSTYIITPAIVALIGLQALIISSNKLSTPVKQLLATPLLAADLLIPINFTANHKGT